MSTQFPGIPSYTDPTTEPKPNPVSGLFHSRKFLLMLLDVLISTLLYFVTKYVAPGVQGDVNFLIAAYQPVFVFLIGAIAYEDGQQVKAAAMVHSARLQNEMFTASVTTHTTPEAADKLRDPRKKVH